MRSLPPRPDLTDPRSSMAPSRPAPGRTALLILGAPGSGGATLARVLEAAGAAAPADPAAIARFNDSRLAQGGAGWTDPFGPRRREDAAAEEPAEADVTAARALLRTAEPHPPLLVLDDPRHTRLAALWTAALDAEGWRCGFVVLVRPPGAAAAALKAAEGVTRNAGLLLWASYMLQADRVARGGRRVAVAFDRLAADPEAELDRIERGLGLRLPRRTWDSAAEIEALLRDGGPAPAGPALPPALAPLHDLHGHLQASAQDEPENTDTAAETARWFASLTDVMGPVLHQVRREGSGGPAGGREPQDDPRLRAELDAARRTAMEASARTEEAEARMEIVQAALTVARRRSAEAEALLQRRATEASAGERDARASLASALSARDGLDAVRRELEGALQRAGEAQADLERRLSEAGARTLAIEAEIEDEQARHREARERLALTGVSSLAAQARVRELQAQLDETRTDLDRRRRWLPRLFGLR